MSPVVRLVTSQKTPQRAPSTWYEALYDAQEEAFMNFWSGIVLGMFMGTTFGVFIMQMLAMGKIGDDQRGDSNGQSR